MKNLLRNLAALFIIIGISIFLSQALVMYLLPFFHPVGFEQEVFLSAFLLTIFSLPILYFLLFRPLLLHTKELEQADAALKQGEERYRSLVESTEDSIYLIDRSYRYLFMNRKHASRLGFSSGEYTDKTYRDLHSADEFDEFAKMVDRVFQTGLSVQHEHKSRRDGRYFLRTLSPVRDASSETVAVTVISKQITERKKIEEQLLILSLTDELTGLYNRRGFMNMAEQQIKLSERMKTGMYLLSADLDNLKMINDTFGHKTGDEALKEAAGVLRETFRNVDILARIGGDEFVVLMLELTPSHSDGIEDRLQSALDIHNARKGRAYRISFSTGLAYYPYGSGLSVDDLLVQADKLMYEQKRRKQKAETS